jgi:Ni,Fe-hydrogenase I cytochrome b subunit
VILLSIIIFAIYIYFNSKNYNYKQQIVSVNQKEYYENIKTLQKMREEEDNETLKKYLEKKEKEKKIMQDLQK